MLEKSYTLKNEIILPSSLERELNSHRFCVMDIETTGLSANYCEVILIGVLYPKSNEEVILTQFFAESPKEEVKILTRFAEVMESMDAFITFNGASFDLPFLKKRFERHNLPWPFETFGHVDILQHVRKNKKHLNLENLKLKTLEHFLGIHRKDTISGKESVLLYKEYVKMRSPSLAKTILLHNYEDIYYLPKVFSIFDHFPASLNDQCTLHSHYLGKALSLNFLKEEVKLHKGSLLVKGTTNKIKNALDEVHYTPLYDLMWSPTKGEFHITIPLQHRTKDCQDLFYVNLSQFNLNKETFVTYQKQPENFFQDFMLVGISKSLQSHTTEEFVEKVLQTAFQAIGGE